MARRKISSGERLLEEGGGAGGGEKQPAAAAPETTGGDADRYEERHPKPWGGVVRSVLSIDVREVYARLERELSLGDGASEYGSVLRSLDRAERNAFDSVKLVRKAKLVDQEAARELDTEMEVLRTSARRALDAEKAAVKKDGGSAKAPTLQEVQDRILANWPDQVASIERRRGEMHAAFRAIEGLSRSWFERCATLREMIKGYKRSGTA